MGAQVRVPEAVERSLEQGATLAVSVSGGKDSQAMLSALVRLHQERGWPGELYAVHADLGRAEWEQTPEEVERQCQELGVRLEVVRREAGDMLDRWEERMHQLEGTGKPFWSSAAQRYCTSDLKRDPIDKHLREHQHVVCAMGLRAQESSARAGKDVCQVRSRIATSRNDVKRAETAEEALERWTGQGRMALTWNPIHHWLERDVWEELGTSLEALERRRALAREGREQEALEGWPAHPAYVWGNERLSCALCVLASRSDLVNGAQHNPDTWAAMYRLEQESGASFRQDISLQEIGMEAGLLEPQEATEGGQIPLPMVA